MRRPIRARIWLAVALAAAGAACSEGPPPPPIGEAPNPIEVTLTPVSHSVHFAPGTPALSTQETLQLSAFLNDEKARPDETMAVQAEAGTLGEARRSRVIAALRRAGFAPVAAPSVPNTGRDTVAVTLERGRIAVPHCPNWQQYVGSEPFNTSSTNLGCATSVDLYVMVADPRDLISGREPGPADAAPSVRAVDAYRTGKKLDDGGSGGSATSPSFSPGSSGSGGSNAH